MRSVRTGLGAVLALTVAFASASAVAGCADEATHVDTSGLDLITTDIAEPQNSLIPADSNDVPGQTIINLVYSGLMYLDEDGDPHYDMAESVTQVNDTTYDVVIREDAVFSDGSEVDAKDFVDTWNTAVRQSLLSAHNFEPILGFHEGQQTMRGLTVTGKKSFRIELSRPTAGFLERLGYSVFFPMRSEDQDDLTERGTDPIGNGPYLLASWEHEEALTIVPNPRYEGPRIPQNEGIKFVVYPTEDQAYEDLVDGNLDVLVHIPGSKLATFEDELGSQAVSRPVGSMIEITIPANASNFRGEAGRLRRRALSMAVDREKLARELFHDTVIPANGFVAPLHGTTPPAPTDATALTYQPEKARELWEKAEGMDPFEGTFSIAYNLDGSHQKWVEAVAQQMTDTLGVPTEGRPFETFKQMREEVTARHITGAFRTSWQAEYPDESSFLAPLFASYSAANESGFRNATFDDLLEQAGKAATDAEADEYYKQAQDLLVDAMPAIPLWTSKSLGAYGKDIIPACYTWKPLPNYYLIQRSSAR